MSDAAFAYTAPTIVWFAKDGLARLASYLKRLDVSRAIVVCDARAEQHGLATRAMEASGGRAVSVWSGVAPDAPLESVMAGAEFARQRGADGVVAIGGGSSIATRHRRPLLDAERWPRFAARRLSGSLGGAVLRW